MINEIGSEFHMCNPEEGEGFGFQGASLSSALVFSGRTAIETVIKNIKKGNKKLKAALPSYCCDSMIQPFIDLDINITFYEVGLGCQNKLIINEPSCDDVDILLWCNYFGYQVQMPDFSDFKNRGGIIIEDVTHSLLSDCAYHRQSDYIVASIRKWEPVLCGGYCAKVEGTLLHIPKKAPDKEFIEVKKEAMTMKAHYLCNSGDKQKSIFLEKYAQSNKWIGDNYSELTIDEKSKKYLATIDLATQRKIRRNNAITLHKGLDQLKNFRTLFASYEMDCPLFVPIIIEPGKRDIIRRKLIDNDIYCPIHWPQPSFDCRSNLYDVELSLICDQRYSDVDMNRIIEVLSKFDNY